MHARRKIMIGMRWFATLLLSGAAFSMSGCTNDSAQRPQMVQLCVRDDRDADSLIAILERVARENEMNFIDRSRQSHQELIRLGKDPGYRVINVSASRLDGLGVAAGNLGLGPNEVAIGITGSSNPAERDALVQALMNELKSKWEVRNVPAGQGAMPSEKCKASS